jgi:hypothetical protein
VIASLVSLVLGLVFLVLGCVRYRSVRILVTVRERVITANVVI